MKNQVTDDFFLARNGFSQSVTSKNGLSQWQRDICFDQQGCLVYYWLSKNRWFLEPQPPRGDWVPPRGGELLRATHQGHRTTSVAWGTAADVAAGRDKMTKETAEQWQAFDSTDGKGV